MNILFVDSTRAVHPYGTNGSDPWAQAEKQQKGRRLTDSPMGAGQPCDGPVLDKSKIQNCIWAPLALFYKTV